MENGSIKLEKIMGIVGVREEVVQARLFVVSSKDRGIKKLDLAGLTPKARADKLHKWGKDDRFVAVIETGDQLFVHAHAKHAVRLQGIEELSIDGKKATVKALTDEEAEQLSAVGQAFEEYVLEEEKGAKATPDTGSVREIRQFFAPQKLISDTMQRNFVIMSMQITNGQVVLNCLHQMSKAQREAQAEKRDAENSADIIDGILAKQRLKREKDTKIVKDIQLEQDLSRIEQIRGEF